MLKISQNILRIILLLILAVIIYSCEEGFTLDPNNDPVIISRCAEGVIAQLTTEPKLSIEDTNLSYRMRSPRLDLTGGGHVQGVGRLDDSNGKGRMVFCDNGTSSGFRLITQNIIEADEGVFSSETSLKSPSPFDIRNEEFLGDHGHPGGMQAQGDFVAIAMEKGKADHSAIYFLEIEDQEISWVQTLWLDGSRGEPYQEKNNSAFSVGFVQQQNGKFILAVNGPKKRIWFYESLQNELSKNTDWEYIGFFEPICEGYGSDRDSCFVGAQGGLNLIRDCNGELFLFAMNGTDTSPGKEYQYLQVFKIDRSSNDLERIALEKVTQQRKSLGLFATNSFSFRWAGGSYITKDGKIALFNTERKRNERDNDYVDGKVYYGK